jgi:hypothetical protein
MASSHVHVRVRPLSSTKIIGQDFYEFPRFAILMIGNRDTVRTVGRLGVRPAHRPAPLVPGPPFL